MALLENGFWEESSNPPKLNWWPFLEYFFIYLKKNASKPPKNRFSYTNSSQKFKAKVEFATKNLLMNIELVETPSLSNYATEEHSQCINVQHWKRVICLMAAESKGTTRKQCTMFVSHISGMVIAVWEISCVYIYFFLFFMLCLKHWMQVRKN